MRRFLFFLVLGGISLFFESSWLSLFPGTTIRLELVWIYVLYLGFFSSVRDSGYIVIFLGLLEDMIGTPFLGLFATIYFFMLVLVRIFIAHMFIETLWSRLLWVFILSFVATFLEWGLLAIMGKGDGVGNLLVTYGLLQCGFNMIASAVVFPLLEKAKGIYVS